MIIQQQSDKMLVDPDYYDVAEVKEHIENFDISTINLLWDIFVVSKSKLSYFIRVCYNKRPIMFNSKTMCNVMNLRCMAFIRPGSIWVDGNFFLEEPQPRCRINSLTCSPNNAPSR